MRRPPSKIRLQNHSLPKIVASLKLSPHNESSIVSVSTNQAPLSPGFGPPSDEVPLHDSGTSIETDLDELENGAPHVSLRHDLVSEKAVDISIRLQEILGTSDAAKFLNNNVIGIDIALRVLLRPAQRRVGRQGA